MLPELKSSIRELHIDLLLVEEFYSSEEFRTWFLLKTFADYTDIARLFSIEHSVIELERESDIILTFQSAKGDIRVLIENKINAQFQPDQAVDYKKRALGYIERGECAECITVLIAPEAYITAAKSVHLFDYYISYEDILMYFKLQKHFGDRAAYKMEVLKRAVTKTSFTKGVEDPIITRFWKDFWGDISLNVPELILAPPGPKPSASTFIFFRNKLPKRVQLVYKFVHGIVDIQMEGMGEHVEKIKQKYLELLTPEISVERSGKSAMIRMYVTKINPRLNYESNKTAVQEAQRAAIFLLNWFNTDLHLWDQLKAAI